MGIMSHQNNGPGPSADDAYRDFCDIDLRRVERSEKFHVVELDFHLDFGWRHPDTSDLVCYDFKNDVRLLSLEGALVACKSNCPLGF